MKRLAIAACLLAAGCTSVPHADQVTLADASIIHAGPPVKGVGQIDGVVRGVLEELGITSGGVYTGTDLEAALTADPSAGGIGITNLGVSTFATGLGAVTHLTGPSDQDLTLASGAGRNLVLNPPSTLGLYIQNAGTSIAHWNNTGLHVRDAYETSWGTSNDFQMGWQTAPTTDVMRLGCDAANGLIEIVAGSQIAADYGVANPVGAGHPVLRIWSDEAAGAGGDDEYLQVYVDTAGQGKIQLGTPGQEIYYDAGAGGGHVWRSGTTTLLSLTASDGDAVLRPNTAEKLILAEDGGTSAFEITTSGTSHFKPNGNSGSMSIHSAEETLSALSGASASTTNLIPAGAIVLAVTCRVTTLIEGATTFDVGDGATVNLWGDAIALTAGTTTDETDYTADPQGTWSASARDVTLTANGSNFTAGAVKVTVYYLTCTAESS